MFRYSVHVLAFLSVMSAGNLLIGEDEVPAEQPPTGTTAAAEAEEPPLTSGDVAPAATGETPSVASHATRLARNFMRLMQNTAGDLLAFAGELLLQCVLWTAGFALLGLCLGFALWLWLRKRKRFDAPWNWYRYIRWGWAVLFFILPPLGMGYAGLWYGGGRCLKHYVEEERALDRIAANLICAVALDQADYEIKGTETAEEYARILSQVEGADQAAEADLQTIVNHLDEFGPPHPLKRWVLTFALTRILSESSEWLHGVDLRMLALLLIEHRNLDEYLAGKGQPPRVLVLFATQMKALRNETISLVNLTVYPQVALGFAAGLGIPLMLWALFRLVVYCCNRKRRDGKTTCQAPAPAPRAPEDNPAC